MDVNRAIRLAVNTGKTVHGIKETKDSVKKKKAKLIIASTNCPDIDFKKDKYKNVPVYHFNGNNHDLGSAAGKPFSISVLTVIEPGESTILSVNED